MAKKNAGLQDGGFGGKQPHEMAHGGSNSDAAVAKINSTDFSDEGGKGAHKDLHHSQIHGVAPEAAGKPSKDHQVGQKGKGSKGSGMVGTYKPR